MCITPASVMHMTSYRNMDEPPLLLSQNCRDEKHGRTGIDQCIGCDCACHAANPTRPATLADWPEAAYWLTHRGREEHPRG